jgi:hypothetical protein
MKIQFVRTFLAALVLFLGVSAAIAHPRRKARRRRKPARSPQKRLPRPPISWMLCRGSAKPTRRKLSLAVPIASKQIW